MEQVQWVIPGDAFQLPRAWVYRSVLLLAEGIHTPTISRSPLVIFGGLHASFFSIRAHLFATSSPPPKPLPDKQPAPDYFLPVGPGFATAIPNCGISDAITQAVAALRGVTGRGTHCRQPGSLWLPHGCPVGFSLPPAITRHNYSMLALIPIQADQVLAGPYLAVYIPESQQQRRLFVTLLPVLLGPRLCGNVCSSRTSCSEATPWSAWPPPRTFRPLWVLISSIPSGWKPPQLLG